MPANILVIVMPPFLLVALLVVIVVIVMLVIVAVVWLRIWLRIWLWVRLRRLWLRVRLRLLWAGRWGRPRIRRHIVPRQQRKPATAALRAFWWQGQDKAPIDVRAAGGQRQEQEKVFHFGSHRLLSAKCSCRLPSCASSVGLPFLRPLEPCEI
jgi:hypothetical protein